MSIVNKPNTFSGNTTISSSEVNSNFDTLYNEFNGSISAANLADDAVTAAKLADNAVVAANISSDSVTATKIDWASTGTDGGIWWEELGRTTLSGAGDTLSIGSLPARKHLCIRVQALATGGTIGAALTFNADTSTNYPYRIEENGAADATAASANDIRILGASAANFFANIFVMNITTSEKIVHCEAIAAGAAGGGNVPGRRTTIGKWANTANAIATVTVTNVGTGDFAIGSEVVVLGHN